MQLVMKGLGQKNGMDFKENFLSMVNISFQIALGLAISVNLEIG